jgi:hypothetical protein
MLGFSSLILIQIFLKCKTNACNDDDKVLYLFNKLGMLHHSGVARVLVDLRGSVASSFVVS